MGSEEKQSKKMKVIGWGAGIIGAIIAAVAGTYFSGILEAKPDLILVSAVPSQANDPGGQRGVNAIACGGFLSNGCDYGYLTYKVNNQGNGEAKGCRVDMTSVYDATGSHDGTMVKTSELGHQEVPLRPSDSFSIPPNGSHDDQYYLPIPYTGDYKFSGNIACQNGNVSIPEKSLKVDK